VVVGAAVVVVIKTVVVGATVVGGVVVGATVVGGAVVGATVVVRRVVVVARRVVVDRGDVVVGCGAVVVMTDGPAGGTFLMSSSTGRTVEDDPVDELAGDVVDVVAEVGAAVVSDDVPTTS